MKIFDSATTFLSCSFLMNYASSFSSVRPFATRGASSSTSKGLPVPYQTMSSLRMVGFEEVITPSIILLGAAAASIYVNSGGQMDWGSFVSSTTTDEAEVKAEEPAPAPVVVDKIEPAPVVEKKKSETGATSSAPKTTTELVKEVASTRQDQLDTENLVASRQAAAAKATITAAKAVESVEEPAKEETEEPIIVKKKGLLLIRVIKKVVAPWRKWSNIY